MIILILEMQIDKPATAVEKFIVAMIKEESIAQKNVTRQIQR